jgi:demethylmenaquinone methyltransferase/2-methoxy-6-polyprenyl-1,4-benzoquinol methylase
MTRIPENDTSVIQTYRARAQRYDLTVSLFNLFGFFGFNIEAWRREAVRALHGKPGDTVVDIGCGTGLNFALLQDVIGPEGQIIGVDLSDAMLDQARRRVTEYGWKNVTLVQADAAQFEFPTYVDGIISTFALTLVPDCGRVIENGCAALASGGRIVVLDMAWPRGWPEWWRHVLFFLQSYGVTGEVIRRRPWDTVWRTMQTHLVDVARKEFWMGFFYLAAGTRTAQSE